MGQWDPPLVMFSSPQHPQDALDVGQGNEVTPLGMLSKHPASPLPFFSQLEFLGRASEGAGTAPSISPL